jgi:hypothetical protein
MSGKGKARKSAGIRAAWVPPAVVRRLTRARDPADDDDGSGSGSGGGGGGAKLKAANQIKVGLRCAMARRPHWVQHGHGQVRHILCEKQAKALEALGKLKNDKVPFDKVRVPVPTPHAVCRGLNHRSCRNASGG